MIFILITALLFSLSQSFYLPEILAKISERGHHFCLQSLPSSVENLSSLEALVCGKNMQDPALKPLLVQSSLIHIFVVSGSHFLFLRKIIAHLPILRKIPLLLLSLYALITLCQAPAVRALVFLALAEISESKKLFLSPVILVLLSTCFCVALFPQWLHSRSLMMSSMAALTLALVSEVQTPHAHPAAAQILLQSALYGAMAVCLWGLASLHPLGIVLNVLLGPLIGGGLFLLAFLVVMFPPLHCLFDGALGGLVWILEKHSELLALRPETRPLALPWQWAWFFTLFVFSHFFLIRRKRHKAARG